MVVELSGGRCLASLQKEVQMKYGLLYFTASMLMLFGPATVRAAEPQSTGHGMEHLHNASSPPGWVEQLKGQTIIEDVMEGRAERTAMVARPKRK